MDIINLFNIINPAWGFLLLLPLVGYICWANPYEYNSFAATVAAIGGNSGTIMIPNEQIIDANLVIPSNITLEFIHGGYLNIAVGKTVTINGPIEAGSYQIFKGNGTVSLGAGIIEAACPEWWDDVDKCATAFGGNEGTVFISNPQDVVGNLTIPSNITLKFINGGYLSGDAYSIRNATYQWTLSAGAGAVNTYYLELNGGGDPGIINPVKVYENGTCMPRGDIYDPTTGLFAGEWDWGNNDALGFNTIYVRLTDNVDPDTKALNYMTAAHKITINGNIEAGLYQIFEGNGSIGLGTGAIKETYPEWWGAVGDGVVNDSIPIQSMFSGLPATYPPNVKLTRNYLTDKIAIKEINDLIICGGGKLTANESGCYFVDIYDCDRIKISKITIDGDSEASRAIDLYKSPDFIISKCRVLNIGDGSVAVAAIYIAPECHRGKIVANHIENVVGTASRAIEINNFRDNTTLSSDIIIANNTIKDISPVTDADGIFFSQANKYSNGLVEGNIFINCYKRAVKIQTDGVTVEGNKIYRTVAGAGYSAVSAYGNDITIENNKVKVTNGWYTYMFSAQPVTNLVIRNNETENPAGASGQSCDGVHLEAGVGTYFNTKINGNSFKYFKYGVRLLADADNLEICDNRFDQADSHFIYPKDRTINKLKIIGNIYDNGIHNFLWQPTAVTDLIIKNNVGNSAWGFFNAAPLRQTDILIGNNICNATPMVGANMGISYVNGLCVTQGAAAPGAGTWVQGDICWNTAPAAGGPPGWVCTTGGTPGTWKAMANVAA